MKIDKLTEQQNLIKIIKNNNFFGKLDPKFCEFLGKNAVYLELPPENFIFSARDYAEKFYLVLAGRVSLQMFSQEKGSITLEEIKPGELLGWSWLKSPYKWRFDAVTTENTKLIAFAAEIIRKKMQTNSKFGYAMQDIFLNIIIERLQATRQRLLKEFGDNIYIPE